MAKKKSKSKSKAQTPVKTKVWDTVDDVKLRTLFTKGIRKGGLDPNDLSKDITEALHKRYWPDRGETGFKALYRRKAREWNLNVEKNGGRIPTSKHI